MTPADKGRLPNKRLKQTGLLSEEAQRLCVIPQIPQYGALAPARARPAA